MQPRKRETFHFATRFTQDSRSRLINKIIKDKRLLNKRKVFINADKRRVSQFKDRKIFNFVRSTKRFHTYDAMRAFSFKRRLKHAN